MDPEHVPLRHNEQQSTQRRAKPVRKPFLFILLLAEAMIRDVSSVFP